MVQNEPLYTSQPQGHLLTAADQTPCLNARDVYRDITNLLSTPQVSDIDGGGHEAFFDKVPVVIRSRQRYSLVSATISFRQVQFGFRVAYEGCPPRACCEKVATVFRIKHALNFWNRSRYLHLDDSVQTQRDLT